MGEPPEPPHPGAAAAAGPAASETAPAESGKAPWSKARRTRSSHAATRNGKSSLPRVTARRIRQASGTSWTGGLLNRMVTVSLHCVFEYMARRL